jgi:SAM-dependent methyltransferase
MATQSRTVFERLYRRAKVASDLPWHRAEPPPLLVEALQTRRVPGAALDIGCGAGTYSLWLARQGWRVTAVDFMPQAVSMLRAEAARQKLDIEALQADITTWQASRTYDIVLDVGCLHSLGRDRHAVYRQQLLRWLAPGGDFILVHCSQRGWWDRWPVGPTRVGRAEFERLFAPELELRESRPETLTGLPFFMGWNAEVGRYWFHRRA